MRKLIVALLALLLIGPAQAGQLSLLKAGGKVSAGGGGATPVKNTSNSSTGSAATAPVTITTTAANCLLLLWVESNAGPLSGVADTQGLTWTQVAAAANPGASNFELWKAVQTSAGANTITATLPSSNFFAAGVIAITGANNASPFNGSAVVGNSIPFPADPLSITTSASNAYVLAGYRTNASPPSAGSTWTAEETKNFFIIESKAAASPTTLSATMTAGAAQSDGGIAVAVVP